jgi:hypothetical protein
MSEHEGGEGRTTGAFFLGFLLGVLLCLGAGGTLLVVRRGALAQEQVARMEAERAAMAERDARRAAEEARAALRAKPKAGGVDVGPAGEGTLALTLRPFRAGDFKGAGKKLAEGEPCVVASGTKGPLSLDEAGKWLKEKAKGGAKPAVVRTDPEVKAKDVVGLVDALREAGYTKVSLTVLEAGKE